MTFLGKVWIANSGMKVRAARFIYQQMRSLLGA